MILPDELGIEKTRKVYDGLAVIPSGFKGLGALVTQANSAFNDQTDGCRSQALQEIVFGSIKQLI